jgi:RHS repeat-associated protein
LFTKNSQIYDFDRANRLTSVMGKENYRYDGLGRRVYAADSVATLWQYSQDGRELWASDARRQQNRINIYLGNTVLATRTTDWSSGAVGVRYLHTDALGSPVAETDSAGAVVKRNSYEPYGAQYGANNIDGIGYTGHVMDQATGLTYMQQRYYDAQVGRFLGGDPVMPDTESGSNFNRYWYGNNNPSTFFDPDGREASGTSTKPPSTESNDSIPPAPPGCGHTRSCYWDGHQWHVQETDTTWQKFDKFFEEAARLVNPFISMADCIQKGCKAVGWTWAAAEVLTGGEGRVAQAGFGTIRRKAGSLGLFKGTNALRKENKMFSDAARAAGLNKAEAARFHAEISGGEQMNFQELVEAARAFKGIP